MIRARRRARADRRPVWSGLVTHGLAARIPPDLRQPAVVTIKAIHTAIFLSIAALVAVVAFDGARQRPRGRTLAAAVVAVAESIVYASNNRVCPLTTLAEELGADDGSVTDLFLPEAVSRRIPAVAGSSLGIGLVLNVLAIRRGRETSP